jgi:hypothetical protein
MKIKEYLTEQKKPHYIPDEYWNDPLYKAVLTAKSEKEQKEKIDILISIRGKSAWANFQKIVKKKISNNES